MIKKVLILCTVLFMTNMMAFTQAKSVDKGQRGHHVQKIQTMLVHQGYLKDSADGIFGHNTELAVRKFQKAKGLTVDGRVGTATMNALEKDETRFGDSSIARSHSGIPNKYVRVLTMHASAYSSQDPGNSNYTATGSRLKKVLYRLIRELFLWGRKCLLKVMVML